MHKIIEMQIKAVSSDSIFMYLLVGFMGSFRYHGWTVIRLWLSNCIESFNVICLIIHSLTSTSVEDVRVWMSNYTHIFTWV